MWSSIFFEATTIILKAAVSADEDEQGNLGSGLKESGDRESKEVAFSADEDKSRSLDSD